MNLKQLSKEERKEMSFIEVAFIILEESKQPITFQEILNQIQQHLELSDEEVRQRMVQFYTDLNFDGRFITLGENRWGLRAWYPVDQLEEEVTTAVKTRKKKTKKAAKEEELEEEVEDLDEADEDFDFDEEDIDDLDDEDEIEELDDLSEIDEEDDEDEDDFDDELVAEDEYDLDDDEDDDQK
ncbi:DNA-directed RNA polymerase subunit delta [Bacillus sp. FJAT-42315]|uniref:DNA-directed RNA polymerase subunit delta n=1 Tax=Bacillus sp. FJAT-42315 TaxID=2014077 RepID=UPI000C24771C|nr:DNA-directed RNA polymerase subunit delta [Bacillus sp. FJAT-42315]